MSTKRSLLNYLFLLGIGLFHVYVIFHKQIHMSVSANGHASGADPAGCPLRMAKSFFSTTFMSSSSYFVSRPLGLSRRSPMKTNLNIVDVNKGQNVLSYVRNMNEFSNVQLFATAEPMIGGTSSVAPKLSMSMSVPVPTMGSPADVVDDLLLTQRRLKKKSAAEALEVAVLGLSHHTASVDVRERLSIPEAFWNDASGELCDYDSIHEAAVLSTCNRFEIYVAGKNPYECMRDAIDYLHKRSGGSLDISTLRQNLFLLTGEDAAWHLLRVSAGLDSLVVGEGQILSQVKRAHEHGIHNGKGQAGKVVSRMLNTAVTAGKRVRTETGISRGAVSVSSAAAEFTVTRLREDCGVKSIGDARITILGAGKMARLLLVHLQTLGVGAVTILSRGVESIQKLQEEFPEMAITAKLMDELYETVAQSDVVYPCTSSTSTIIDPEPLAQALSGRSKDSGVMFVDISVPRNVHADCDQVPGAACYNVDHLKAVVKRNTGKRKKEMQDAELILKEELGKFRLWQQSLGAIPTITRLQEKAEALRQEEMVKAAKKLSSLSEKDLDTVEKVTKGIVAKLIHGPMSHLRQQQEGDATRAAILQVQQAFQLEDH